MINLNGIYAMSSFVQIVQKGDSAIIWHSLFGNPKIVSTKTVEFLQTFMVPTRLGAIVNGKISNADIKAIEELIRGYFLIAVGLNERRFLKEKIQEREAEIINGSLINYLELIVSEMCNFRCIYCIHFSNIGTSGRINDSKFMRFVTAKKSVDQYLKILNRHGKRIAEINFGGGEPLLAWPVIKQTLEYCSSAYGSQFEFHFSINTNASLITCDIAKTLKNYRVEIASSLDGLRDGNDRVRLTKSGHGTFSQIMHGFGILARTGYPLDGIAVTVTQKNFDKLDESIVDWAVANKMKDLRIDIDVVNVVEVPIEDIVSKLMHIRRYAMKRAIDITGFWSRPVENLNESAIESRVAFCGAVRGNSICVNPSGNIYGCGYSTIPLGTLSKIESLCAFDTLYHRFVKSYLIGAIESCKGCMIEGQCGGGCNITREFSHATNNIKTERMCEFYRRMTRELLLEQI